MFRGHHPARVDDKGRLKLPAEFKRICDEQYGASFFVTCLHGKRAEIFPMKEWEAIEAQVKGLAGPAKSRFLFEANVNGNTAEMDSQGRMLISQRMREKLGLTGDVLVIGMETHLTVIDEKAPDAGVEAEPKALSDEDLAVLNIPGL